SRRRYLQPGYLFDFLGKFAFRIPSVVGALHSDPDRGAVAEQLTESDRDRWRYRLALCQDIVKVLAGKGGEGGDLGLRFAGRRNYFAQQFARMRRAPIRIALSGIFGHGLNRSYVSYSDFRSN